MVTRRLDVRGRACPIPLVELMSAMRDARGGECVEVVADDRAFPANVTAWCRRSGHQLVKLEERTSGVHAAIVQKT